MVGGGGGASQEQGSCCGAAGGNILCTQLNIQTGVTYSITVGAGGAAGCTAAPCRGQPGGVGANGGFSSFNELRAPGGGGAHSVAPSPLAIAQGGIGGVTASYENIQAHQMIRSLPLSYPGYVGSITRARLNTFPRPSCYVATDCNYFNSLGVCNSTMLETNRILANCANGTFPVACAIPTCPPACTTPVSVSCRVVCSSFYNVELTGQPYSGSYFITGVPGPCAPTGITCQFNIACNSIGCSRYGGGCLVTRPVPSGGPCIDFAQCMSIPNNPNTGHSGRQSGCNGDSGVVVLFYPTSISAATSFPGGIDCTPVSCPFGMRAYKFTSSGSITI